MILILILYFPGLPDLLVNSPAFKAEGFTHQAPRNLNPSFVAVIKVFSLLSSSPHFLDNTSLTHPLILLASSLVPEINITKSSAYLRYISLLKFGSLCIRLGIFLLSIANRLISGDPGWDFCSRCILLVNLSYSLFLAFFLPISNLLLI